MDRRGWFAMVALGTLAVGCAPVDPTQYKSYNQILAQHPATATNPNAADSTDSESASVPARGTDAADSQPAASANEPANVAAVDAASTLTAPTMKVVNGKVVVQTLPGGVRLLVPDKDLRTEGPKGALRVTYDDLDLLRILNMEPVTTDAVDYFPDWLKNLNGKRVRIRGFMAPSFEATGIERFDFARDTGVCCFGPQAKLYYHILVQMQAGKTADYVPNHAFDVVGTFRIQMDAEQGQPLGLYWIDDAQIIER